MNNTERCENCEYFHRLKHNFKRGVGFEESHCCDVIMHLPRSKSKIDDCEPWIQEVPADGRCEMFTNTAGQEAPSSKRSVGRGRMPDLAAYFLSK